MCGLETDNSNHGVSIIEDSFFNRESGGTWQDIGYLSSIGVKLALASQLTVVITSVILTIVYIRFLPRLLRTGDEILTTSSTKAIIITGCDSGIGLELAKYLFKTTKFTLICGYIDASSSGYRQIDELSRQEDGTRLNLTLLDITKECDVNGLLQQVRSMIDGNPKLESLHAVINNAGTMIYGELDWQTPKHIEDQISVNLLGTIRLTRALLPFVIRDKGRFINISSVNDTTVFPGLSVYSSTKSALTTFSRGLGYELRKFNAHVVTMRLGDFARLTNIMTRHSANRDEMWQGMSTEKRQLYGGYFDKFNEHLLNNYGMTSPRNFQDSPLFDDFRRALLSKNPPTTITCASLPFRIFYFIIELLPVWIQYIVLDLLFKFGFKWNDCSSSEILVGTKPQPDCV